MRNIINNNFNLDKLFKALKVTAAELKSDVRTQRLGDARALFAAKLIEQPGVLQTDIARYLHTTQASVSLMIKRHNCLLIYPHYRSLWFRVSSLVISTGAKRSGEISDNQIINN